MTLLSHRWLLYAAAWLPYWVLVLAAMLATPGVDCLQALSGSTACVATAALLGAGLWLIYDRRPWQGRGRTTWALWHIGLALSYSGLWSAAIFGFNAVHNGTAAAWAFVAPFIAWHFVSGLFVCGLLAGIFHSLHTHSLLRAEQQRTARAEMLRVQAELEALRGRLQPHFLFNTLHSITVLVRHDPAQAEQALLRLSELLRAVLDAQRTVDDVPLADEWQFVQHYLALEKIRLGERLRVVIDLPEEALGRSVPFFTLQPLVENAIRHAVASRAQGGTVRIAATLAGEHLRLTIDDDGPGADPTTLARGGGLGLRIVRQRLEMRHRGRAELRFDTAPGAGFRAIVTLPPPAALPA